MARAVGRTGHRLTTCGLLPRVSPQSDDSGSTEFSTQAIRDVDRIIHHRHAAIDPSTQSAARSMATAAPFSVTSRSPDIVPVLVSPKNSALACRLSAEASASARRGPRLDLPRLASRATPGPTWRARSRSSRAAGPRWRAAAGAARRPLLELQRAQGPEPAAALTDRHPTWAPRYQSLPTM